MEQAASVGAHALARLDEMKSRHRLIGIDLVLDRDSKAPAHDAAEAVLYRALDLGLSFKTTMGNVLTLTPPLTTTKEQMDQALDIISQALDEIVTP